ncbi:MAG: histidinol-phosphatase [Bacteroidales bacterium]
MHNLTNYHSHSTYCDGKSNIEEFVATAVWLGFSSYGISPHSPIPLNSDSNMRKSRMGDFIGEMENLKLKYEGKIELYSGMEIDYLGDEWNATGEYFSSLPLDYRIGAVHFVKDDDGRYVDIDCNCNAFCEITDKRFGGDIRHLVEIYFGTMRRMIETGGFDFVAHPDKISMNASSYLSGITGEDWYNDLVSDYYTFIASKGVILEVNTKSFYHKGCLFPNKEWFSFLNSLGVQLVVNSDAHIPVLMTQGYSEVKRMLKDAGYTSLMQFKAGEWCKNML